MADLSLRIAQLSPAKRALLEQRMLATSPSPRAGASIPRREQGGPCTLSRAQKRFWFLEQISPGDPSYILPLVSRLHGNLNIEALADAIASVVQRHEILRTVYRLHDGDPLQVITADTDPIRIVDLTVCPEERRETELHQKIECERLAAFALNKGPIFRAILFKLSAVQHVLFLAAHHIAFDGWSVAPLYRDISHYYQLHNQASAQSLPELLIQYADYAVWEQKRDCDRSHPLRAITNVRASAVTDTANGTARTPTAMHGSPIEDDQMTVIPHRHCASGQYARVSNRISGPTHHQLSNLTRSENITPFTALLAIFGIALQSGTGYGEQLICIPFANRVRPELEEMVGCFIGTLVLRPDLTGDSSFRELLHRIDATVTEAFADPDRSQTTLFGGLDRADESGRSMVPDIMFRYTGAPPPLLTLSGIEVANIPTDQVTANFRLNLTITAGHDGASLVFDYNTSHYSQSRVEQILHQFNAALARFCDKPDLIIAQPPSPTPVSHATHQSACQPSDAACSPLTAASVRKDSAACPHSGGDEPADTMETQILALFRGALGRAEIGVNDGFFEHGGHSLSAMALHAQIERLIGHELPLSQVFRSPTVRELAAALKIRRSIPRWLSLLPLRTEGSRPPLFFVQHHADTVTALSGLTRRMPTAQPVYGLQSRGMEQLATPLRDIHSIAAHSLAEIREVQPHGPYLLGGTCDVGGAVAFEMAHQLEVSGEAVRMLVLFDARMNSSPNQRATKELMSSFLYSQVHRVDYHLFHLLKLPFKQRLSALVEKFKRRLIGARLAASIHVPDRNTHASGAAPSRAGQDGHRELPPYLADVRAANLEALAKWQPQRYGGRVTLFWSRQYFEERELDRGVLEWLEFAGGGLEMHVIGGDHHSLFREPVIDEVATKLNRCIEQALVGWDAPDAQPRALRDR